ncbi:voltage-gated potassium channel [Microvirga guangxiensis]|uniref:Voltage-gated potassium channel n=2 Tax=Microvirga guangxiensis TaxID=549386 RepID=A0A1G5KW25_9HYPH|nr:potassium channel family protein [Microvirga guangxiensis]SCZ04816.1 voltage-gated potassium channel [Microvirga guangxiensis]
MLDASSRQAGGFSRWPMVEKLRFLYESDAPEAHRFRYGLLLFDIATILFIVVTSFLPRYGALEWVDVVIGLAVLADFLARIAISRNRLRDLAHPVTFADIAAIVSFLAPVVGEGIGFLRILRTVRLLRTYQLLARLRADSVFFRRNEELIIATVNLGVFIFIMTGFVYETQRWTNEKIGNYVDALYFTIAALTTTGFGDITLTGTLGHLISVIIMIFGVTLFLRLVQVLLRPNKVRYPCPVCGLQRHDRDAIHCKACGTILNIPDEGAV